MTALILHIVWSIFYFIVLILFNIIFFIFFNNNVDKIRQLNNNYFINKILILFVNRNLTFYNKVLKNSEIRILEIQRMKYWPTVNLIHSNIDKLFNTDVIANNIDTPLSFKQHYNTYKFLNENLNIQNIFNNNLNEKINYIILSYIIKINYKFFYRSKLTDLIISLVIFKNSISSETIIVKTYNLLKFNDYLNYSTEYSTNSVLNKSQLTLNKSNLNFKIINNNFNFKIYNTYKKFPKLIYIYDNYFYLKIFNNYLQLNTLFNTQFLTELKTKYLISFSASTIVKYLSDYSINNSIILYLRKNKIFNKSRYSRNRQTYRTGAYWCLYVNIIAVVAFYFWFYKFTMNFGYLWWLLYSLIASFFIPRALKYRFYNPFNIYNEFLNGLTWFLIIIINIFKPLINIIIKIKIYLYNYLLTKFYQNKYFNYFLEENLEIHYIKQSFLWIKLLNNYLLKYINNYLYK